jgi:hypothetical protein
MNELIFCILGYISLSIISEYRYNPNNNIFKILSYYSANMFIYMYLRDVYNKNELKVASFFISENIFNIFKYLYVFFNIFIDFVQNRDILFYVLLIAYYKDIEIFMYIVFFNILYTKLLIPSIKLIMRRIKKNEINDDLEIYLQKNIIFVLMIYLVQIIFLFIKYMLYKY